MEISRAALVVVDMQNGFLNDRSRYVVPHVVDLVQQWEARGGTTLFTRYFNYPDSPYERLIHWSKMQEAPETDIAAELLPYAQRVVDKTIYSLFNEEGAALVASAGWSDLVFCGVATDGCVLKSAADAFERGYTPWVVRDACASHAGDEIHKAGLRLTERFIGRGQVVSAAELLAKASRVAA